MYVMLGTLKQFIFCSLQRCIIYSNVHEAFPFCINVLVQHIGFKNICSEGLNKVLIPESCTSCENLNSGAEETETVNVCFWQ